MRRSRRLEAPGMRLPGKRLSHRTSKIPRSVPPPSESEGTGDQPSVDIAAPAPSTAVVAKSAKLRRADGRGLDASELTIVANEGVPWPTKERARKLVLRVAAVAPRPVLRGRVVLNQEADPARERPAVVKASLDFGGRPVRARATARRMLDAIDLLEQRLRRNLEDRVEIDLARRHDTGTARRQRRSGDRTNRDQR